MPDQWDLKQAEWRGYTVKALEGVEEELDRLNEELRNTKEKLQNLEVNYEQSKIYRKLIIAFAAIVVSAMVGGGISAIIIFVV